MHLVIRSGTRALLGENIVNIPLTDGESLAAVHKSSSSWERRVPEPATRRRSRPLIDAARRSVVKQR